MDFFDLLIGVTIVFVVIKLAMAADTSNRKKKMESDLSAMPDFTASQQVMGDNGKSGIAVDEERMKVCLIEFDGISDSDIVSYRDLLSSEIFEDSSTVTKTSRGSQLGGAVVGGIALGGIGAIVGGLSGKTVSSEKVKIVGLRIVVNRTANPVHEVCFMNLECKRGCFLHSSCLKRAQHWHGLLDVLIQRAQTEDSLQNGAGDQVESNPALSVADELSKLSDLKKQGLLTNEEFALGKAKLLS